MLLIVANEKGGSGKTTCAAGIASALARRRRVVLVDTDAQQGAAAWLDGTQALEVVAHPQAAGSARSSSSRPPGPTSTS